MAKDRISRREFARNSTLAATGLAVTLQSGHAGQRASALQAGQGVVDTAPPLGIEMAGFHRAPGNERRITGIRQPTAARAILLQSGDTLAAIVSLDICGMPREMVARVQARVARRVGVPAANVRVCATHTHSMPTFRYFRQWGAVSAEYMAVVEGRIVRAVELATADLAPAELYVGKSRAAGANFNRTSKTWKTDKEFAEDSTDADRWLDTMVRVMHFRRPGQRPDLLWYHFSAHPVCYTDADAGPDWPGLVDAQLRKEDKVSPSFLQGHIGDVNPGSGKPWLGVPEETAARVAAAVRRAMDGATRVRVGRLRVLTQQTQLPLDIERLEQWIAQYRRHPSKCNGGPWVDAPFAKDWFQSAAKWDLGKTHLSVPLTAMQLGEVGLLLHPAELYSFYGLAIQRDSPLSDVFVVGYTDAFIGYLPDPRAYENGEYAAIVVPKICDLPPFRPTTAGQLARAAVDLLKRVGAQTG